MSNKKTPTSRPLKKRDDSNENKNIPIPKKENNKMKHVLVANGNTSLGVNFIFHNRFLNL